MFKKLFGFAIENPTPKQYFGACFLLFIFTILGGAIGFLFGSYAMNEKIIKNYDKSVHSVALDNETFVGNLKKNIPNLKTVTISETSLNGLREVVISDSGEVFYASNDGKNIFIGAWVDENGKNITKEKMDVLAKEKFAKKIKDIDKNIAIKIGNGTNEVIEFTDVDCPFCKQAEGFFDTLNSDATRYVFLTPIDSLHPDAAKKSIHVLCASDPAIEYKRLMSGELTAFNTCQKGEDLLKAHRIIGEKMEIQGTPQFFVNGVHFGGANPLIYEEIKKK